MITDRERETALALLARSRSAVLNAVEGVTEEQARWKPMPERWSILEYIEHLAVSDDGLVALVKKSLESPPYTETEEERRAREQKIRETPIPRGVNRAPEHLRPVARFDSLTGRRRRISGRARADHRIRDVHYGRFAEPLRAASGPGIDGRVSVAVRKCEARGIARRARGGNSRHGGFPR